MSLDFKITRQFGRGDEKTIAKFCNENDALEFMEAKAAWDNKTKVDTAYRLYQDDEQVKAIDSKEYENDNSGQQSAGKGYRVSPFSNAPKPPGGNFPGRSIEDEDDV